MKTILLLVFVGAAGASSTAAMTPDLAEVALTRCLDSAAGTSTGGQSDCQAVAQRAYDRRMNAAYAMLMKRLPVDSQQRLRISQRSWLAFRDAEVRAQAAFFNTRRGTMYVPMQAAAETAITRDRALQLETWVRIAAIDG